MTDKKIAALFDLDGVLIDTEPVYTEIWRNIDRTFPTGVENFEYKIKGTTLPNILNTYFPASQHSEVVEMLRRSELSMAYPLMDGVLRFLGELKDAGIPAAIVTSSNDEKMQRLFGMYPGFRDFFKIVVTDSMVTHSKPAPDCYLLAARLVSVDPSDCFVFEDSYNGLAAGRGAGARVVALATSNPADSLYDKADTVIGSLADFTLADLLAL